MKRLIISLALLSCSIPLAALGAQSGLNPGSKTPERLIEVNPVGLMLGGLSWVEVENHQYGGNSLSFRGGLIRYDYDETGEQYEYHEEGTGFSVGTNMRSYLNGHSMSGLYGGIGVDVGTYSWKWNEDDYSYHGSGNGNDLVMALSFQIGGKIFLSDTLFIDPALYSGYFLALTSSEKESDVVGLFIMPVFAVGTVF